LFFKNLFFFAKNVIVKNAQNTSFVKLAWIIKFRNHHFGGFKFENVGRVLPRKAPFCCRIVEDEFR